MDVASRNPGVWACPVCAFEAPNESLLQRHMKNHAETEAPQNKEKKKKERTKTHTCEATGCHRSFHSDAQLQSHKKYLHPDLLVGKKKKKNKKAKEHGIFSCPVCDGFFQKKEHLRVHVAHHGIQFPSVFPCYFCRRAFYTEEGLRQHKEAKGHGSSFLTERAVSTAESPTDHHISAIMDQEHKLQSQMKADNPSLPHPGVVTIPLSMEKRKKSKKKKNVHPRCNLCELNFNSTIALQLHLEEAHEVKKPPSPSISGKSEVMVNQQEPKSIFVMLSSHATHYGFLYEIDLDKLEENEGKKDEHTQPLLYPVLELFDKKWEIPKSCLFHGARFGSKVYILCNEIKFPCRSPLRLTDAFCFDTNDLDSNLQRFSPPKSAKIWCAVISAYGKLYYLAYPSCYPHIKNDSFERYDPIIDSWESLPPFPHYSEANLKAQISGHAVLYGYILISMLSKKGCQLTAFHIATKTWHHVRLSGSMEKIHDGFRGRAVVVDNIIYALSSEIDELLAFSFCWDSNDGVDIALRSHYVGPLVCLLIEDQAPLPCPFDLMTTQRLIHLGGRDLCLIQTGWNQYSREHQYVIVTSFRVFSGGQEPYIQTLNSRTFRIPVDKDRYYFDIDFGFTRGFSEIEPEEGERCVTAFARGESS